MNHIWPLLFGLMGSHHRSGQGRSRCTAGYTEAVEIHGPDARVARAAQVREHEATRISTL